MRIASLHVHPIKACRGVPVREATVDTHGIVLDRRYMVVDDAGRFLTQRTESRLALVHTAIESDGFRAYAEGDRGCTLPFAPPEGPRREVEVWGFRSPAVEVPEASRWLSAFLGRPCRVVGMPDDVERPAGSMAKAGTLVRYADAYPVLAIGQASLDALNGKLERPVTMSRFRPNVVVEGAAPHAEDEWRLVRVGSILFDAVKRCDRCSVPGIDPETGRREKEPLRTLATYRRKDGKVWFGMNLVARGQGVLRVGDPVVVDETR